MIFDPSHLCRFSDFCTFRGLAPFATPGGLWLFSCEDGPVAVTPEEDAPFLLHPGELLLSPVSLRFAPVEACRLYGIALGGSAAALSKAQLSGVLVQKAARLPGIAEQVAEAASAKASPPPAVCFALFCRLSSFDEAAAPLPELAAEAVRLIQSRYAHLYGVEELAEALEVSKSHLVRSFKAATGKTPGQYLTEIRVEAAKQLLAAEDCPLELLAQLTGFSGANYFCKVFRSCTGMTPAAYRRSVRLPAQENSLVPRSLYL